MRRVAGVFSFTFAGPVPPTTIDYSDEHSFIGGGGSRCCVSSFCPAPFIAPALFNPVATILFAFAVPYLYH